jgi:hypothetical protein
MELSSLPRQYQDVQADTNDDALVARARTGDRDAFADLYERHQGAIFRFALHMTGATASAEDVVQEAFVAFLHAQGPASGGRATATSAGAGQDDRETSILSVPNASLLPRFDHGELIRVEIPSPDGAIQADVLVGQDGLARAIRVIQ